MYSSACKSMSTCNAVQMLELGLNKLVQVLEALAALMSNSTWVNYHYPNPN